MLRNWFVVKQRYSILYWKLLHLLSTVQWKLIEKYFDMASLDSSICRLSCHFNLWFRFTSTVSVNLQYTPFSLPYSKPNYDFCRHFLFMFLLFIGVFGIDPGWQSLCEGHYKIKGQMSALSNACYQNCNFKCAFWHKSWLKL